MKTILLLAIGLVCILAANGQNDGRYRAPITTKRRPSIFARTQRPGGDGRYRPAGDGRYRDANDGRYVPRDDGRYVHIDVGGGAYSGDAGKYVGGPVPTTTRRPIETTAAPRPSVQGKGTGTGGGGWKIIRDDNNLEADGYHYLFETENGILAEERGRIEPLDGAEEGLRSKGFYEYTGDDGYLYRVNYVADNNGFVPEGEHIPKAPPHVARLLAYLAANAPSNRRR